MLYAPSRGFRAPLVCGTLLLLQPYPLKLPPCFFVFISGLAPPVILSMAAFLRLPIRGCLPKIRATHSPRDVVIPRPFLSCGTEVASWLPGAGTRNMPLLAASPAAPATVWPLAVYRYMDKAKAAEALIYLLFPAHPTGYPPDLHEGPLEQLQRSCLLQKHICLSVSSIV